MLSWRDYGSSQVDCFSSSRRGGGWILCLLPLGRKFEMGGASYRNYEFVIKNLTSLPPPSLLPAAPLLQAYSSDAPLVLLHYGPLGCLAGAIDVFC